MDIDYCMLGCNGGIIIGKMKFAGNSIGVGNLVKILWNTK